MALVSTTIKFHGHCPGQGVKSSRTRMEHRKRCRQMVPQQYHLPMVIRRGRMPTRRRASLFTTMQPRRYGVSCNYPLLALMQFASHVFSITLVATPDDSSDPPGRDANVPLPQQANREPLHRWEEGDYIPRRHDEDGTRRWID